VTAAVVAHLLGTPLPVGQAVAPAADGGVPAEPGLYAWWAPAGAVPGIAGPPHPSAGLELLYVGLARSGGAARSTLRSRVVGNHIRGTTGQSTLRRSLASLLGEREGWRTRWTTRPVLVNADELRLSEWMAARLQLTWAVHPAPWTVEDDVIEALQPPLNQAANRGHPLYEHVRAARRQWRAEAAGQRRDDAGDR
jgi:hypothetical protein